MIMHKHIIKIIAVIMAVAVCLCLCAVAFSSKITAAAGDTGISMEYEMALFDTSSVISVNILMDDADWNDMLENATAEEYYQCDVEINGTTFYRVAIRPKGNTSLLAIASDPTTDRYSFKLEFDHYVEGQTCFGLDKLVLNNNYADATNMKEALIYDMYRYLGADASLYNYAKISVNGEYWGVYLALEAVEDSFLLRNYGTQNGELYKPDSMNIGGGDFNIGEMDFGDIDFSNMAPPESPGKSDGFAPPGFAGQMPEGFSASQGKDSPGDETTEQPSNSAGLAEIDFDFAGDRGGFSMGGGGANLNYTDEDLDSYETIWNGEVTKTKKADHQRVVTALKNISAGSELETYMDVDNLLRYMAVHVFSVNEDSLSGMMAHNYYLYESGGKLNIIPWDYNLSLGGMGGGNDATSVVNDAIDNAFSGTTFFDTLMENEVYHSQYYTYLQKLVNEYINGGGFDAFYERIRSQIDALVEADPTAFYSYDEYLTAIDTLYQVVKLRGESIRGQIEGLIPSTETEQRSSNTLVDASSLDLSVMGYMDNGGGGFGFNTQNMPSDTERGEGTTADNEGTSSTPTASVETEDNFTSDFGPSQFGGEMPEGLAPLQFGGRNQDASSDMQQPDNKHGSNNSSSRPSISNFPGISSGGTSQTVSTKYLVSYGVPLLALIAAILFAILYRRRPYKR